MLSESDESDDENDFEEKCPSDCELVIWNKVLELREMRLYQEEIINEIQKSVEVYNVINNNRDLRKKVIH
jgi:hypothetical protein